MPPKPRVEYIRSIKMCEVSPVMLYLERIQGRIQNCISQFILKGDDIYEPLNRNSTQKKLGIETGIEICQDNVNYVQNILEEGLPIRNIITQKGSKEGHALYEYEWMVLENGLKIRNHEPAMKLYAACHKGNVKVLNILLKKTTTTLQCLNMLLFCAINQKHSECVNSLLNHIAMRPSRVTLFEINCIRKYPRYEH